MLQVRKKLVNLNDNEKHIKFYLEALPVLFSQIQRKIRFLIAFKRFLRYLLKPIFTK